MWVFQDMNIAGVPPLVWCKHTIVHEYNQSSTPCMCGIDMNIFRSHPIIHLECSYCLTLVWLNSISFSMQVHTLWDPWVTVKLNCGNRNVSIAWTQQTTTQKIPVLKLRSNFYTLFSVITELTWKFWPLHQWFHRGHILGNVGCKWQQKVSEISTKYNNM